MIQTSIRRLLENHPIIPVVSLTSMDEIPGVMSQLRDQGISCIELTLRTPIAFDVLRELKLNYGKDFDIGVGTLINAEQLHEVKAIGVDFIVSPGLTPYLFDDLKASGIPFIQGVCTPSEVMLGLNMGLDTFKFFPAEVAGGKDMLKNFNAIFPTVKFCPTGGITETNYQSYLDLPNVMSVGGSWVTK